MSSSEHAGFGTRAVHAGQAPDPCTGAIMTPVYMTSTFAQPSPGEFIGEYDYSRAANPTRTALEANLASLENGRHGLCFASGCAALAAVLHLCKQGGRVVLSDDVYGGTFRLFDKVYRHFGLQFEQADLTDPAAAERAITPDTDLVWLETPTNPLLKIADIQAISAVAKSNNALLAVDNTFATPYLQNPLDLGADIVSHSSTKYLGGHSDLIGGALVVNDDEVLQRLKFIQLSVGATPGPMDCFLLLRSTKTLHLRLDRHCDNAEKIVGFLENRSGIRSVVYPHHAAHPHHDIAQRQMRRGGGIITMTLDGGIDSARRFLERLRVFTIAESLGGVESLVDHPAIMTHASVPPEQRAAIGIEDGLVRLSVGVEEAGDLIADLDHALG
ncbi:MAG: cystathionine gamma-synthase [Planctomycetota bacterium]